MKKSARNVFIFNLALSDFLIACSIPLTVIDGFNISWTPPQSLSLCRLIKTFPCVAVYMSSFTVMAVAIDRYRVIVRSSSMQIGYRQAWATLPAIFLVSVIFSSAIFFRSHIRTLTTMAVLSIILIHAKSKQK